MFDDLRESYYFNSDQLKSQEFGLGYKNVRMELERQLISEKPLCFCKGHGFSFQVQFSDSYNCLKLQFQ